MTNNVQTVYAGMDKLITAIESGKANNEKVLIAICKSIKALCTEIDFDDYPEQAKNDFTNPAGIEEMLKGFVKWKTYRWGKQND